MIIQNKEQLKPTFRALFEQAKNLLDNEKKVKIELKQFKTRRSNEQNSYYWVFNGEVADCLNDAGCAYGEFNLPYTADFIHEIDKHIYGVKTTTKLDVKSFCEYMTKLLVFWQEKTGGEFMVSELPDNYLSQRGYTVY